LFVDIGGRADPAYDPPLIVEDRFRTGEEPAKAAVNGAEAILLFVWLG